MSDVSEEHELVELEKALRNLNEDYKFGELCVDGVIYWVIPQVWLQSDIDAADDKAKKYRRVFETANTAGAQKDE